jgi:parallel beta-helix repeat protein
MRRKLDKILIVTLSLTWLLIPVTLVHGATYYLDATGGNDFNDGMSPVSAWRTISKVNSASFNPGDSILFKRGEVWREQLKVPSSGSEGNPITFGAYGEGEKPIINGAEVVTGWTQYSGGIYSASISWTTNQVFEDGKRLQKSDSLSVMSNGTWYLDDPADTLYVWCFDDSNPSTRTIEVSRYGGTYNGLVYVGYTPYIVVKYFNIKYSSSRGIFSLGHHTMIENNSVLYSYADGIYLDFWNGAGADYSIVNNNECSYNNAPYIRWAGSGKVYYIGLGQAITVRASYVIVSNNIVSYNGNIGIDAYLGSTNGKICNNLVFGNLLNGIYLDGASSTDVYNNVVYDNGLNIWSGIALASEEGYPVEYNRVYHNIVYDNFVGLAIDQGEVLNSSIINNVFLNNKYRAVYISNAYAANHKGNIFKNNIFVGKGVLFHLLEAFSKNNTFDYNDWYRINGDKVLMYEGVEYTLTDFFSLTGQDVHSMSQDPMFVDQNNKNFHLQSTSPCIDAGTAVGLTEDLDGTPIPQGNAPDMGVYEYKTASPSNQPPVANAGPDQTITDNDRNGSEQVNLDGSASSDPDGSIVSFIWSEGGLEIGTGINPTVVLSIGTHLITLTVTDNGGLTNTDTVTIKVLKVDREFGELPAGCYNNVSNPTKGKEAIIVVEIKERGYVRIDLYDVKGKKIKELADEEREPGKHRYYWNGRNDNGDVVGSGIYFVHIQAGDYKKTKKIVVVK